MHGTMHWLVCRVASWPMHYELYLLAREVSRGATAVRICLVDKSTLEPNIVSLCHCMFTCSDACCIWNSIAFSTSLVRPVPLEVPTLAGSALLHSGMERVPSG